MAFTFVEIEEHRTRNVLVLFVLLGVLYFLSIVALVWGSRLILGIPLRPSPGAYGSMLLVALLAACVHWLFSTHDLIGRVVGAVMAKPLEPGDTYHQRLKNIVEEVGVATGGRYRIEPYIMPTAALNACAVSDFNNRAAIIVTEGLLARSSRAQLEGVVGHEAAHIASGDSLARSIFCGLFGLHEEALKRLSGLFKGRAGTDMLRGRGGALVLFVMVVLWVTTTAKRLCELCLSREQEYRADAVAVRLTRNPLALAEALHLIDGHWRGVGAQGESLATLFIVDVGGDRLADTSGLVADWFSTHPPTHRRIEALLGMTSVSPKNFAELMAQHHQRPRTPVPEPAQTESPARWLAWGGEEWQGPFDLDALLALPSFTPSSWVRREGRVGAQPAYQDPPLLEALQRRYGQDGPVTPLPATACPRCHVTLTRTRYEGVPLDTCPACRGCYAMPDQVTRVLAREEFAFPERIRRLAALLPTDPRTRQRLVKTYGQYPWARMKSRQCPTCRSAVVRKFFTNAYLVEVEQCWMCGLTWFDPDELELLQYLYEQAKARGASAFLEPG